MTQINVFTEGLKEFPYREQDSDLMSVWKLDEKDIIEKTRTMLRHYIKLLGDKSCLAGYKYKSVTLDIVFCDSKKTHELNREYRDKDKPADIITFAIFADDENRFVFDDDINLGEIVIALDKVTEGANMI